MYRYSAVFRLLSDCPMISGTTLPTVRKGTDGSHGIVTEPLHLARFTLESPAAPPITKTSLSPISYSKRLDPPHGEVDTRLNPRSVRASRDSILSQATVSTVAMSTVHEASLLRTFLSLGSMVVPILNISSPRKAIASCIVIATSCGLLRLTRAIFSVPNLAPFIRYFM